MENSLWRGSVFVFHEELKQARGMVHFTRRLVFGVNPGHCSACFALSEETL